MIVVEGTAVTTFLTADVGGYTATDEAFFDTADAVAAFTAAEISVIAGDFLEAEEVTTGIPEVGVFLPDTVSTPFVAEVRGHFVTAGADPLGRIGVLDYAEFVTAVSVVVVSVVTFVFSIVYTISTEFSANIWVCGASIFSFPSSFNLAIEATIKRIIVSVITLMKSVVVPKFSGALSCTERSTDSSLL